ncbi:MAG: glycosyltransferase 87 family protein [Solirubrobacteraceae bacterium]
MRRRIFALLTMVVLACALAPATASAAAGPPPDVAAPIFVDQNWSVVPREFSIDPSQAIAIAKTSPKLQAIHRAHHPLDINVYEWVHSHYEIYFFYHGKLIADQIVGPHGKLGPTYTGPLMLGYYARGGYGQIFDNPWVLAGFTAMFLLPVLLLRGRRWLDRLDIAMLLGFGVSYALFDTTHLEPGVWAFYPVLIYLMVRMLIRGFKARPSGGRLDCRLPTIVLALGLVALVVARIVITLHPAGVLDVATASVLGAYKILHGQSIYYYSLGHGDTYGPINYLAYVPFEWIWPGNWGYLPAARAATITFDLLTIGGLILVGMRLRGGRDGLRLGLLLAWLFAACPWSLLDVEKSTNDGLVALMVVLTMLALSKPVRRGVLVGLGAAAKFFPAVLLPLVAVGRGDADQQTIRKVLAGFVIAGGASVALFLPPGGLTEMWNHTIGYQLTRTDIFSIWALHPALAPIKDAVTVFAVILAVLVAFRPRGARTPAQVAALGAAVIIAIQLPALHWFYLYIVWFLPLILIAVLGADGPAADEPAPLDRSVEVGPGDPSPVLAGAA